MFFETEPLDELQYGPLRDIALAVDSKLQMGVARKPRLLGKEPQTEGGLRLLLVLVVVAKVHPEIGVLQHIRFGYDYFLSVVHANKIAECKL